VTEVGRDHDYDWAVVEPSSMRSLIQLAGRVRRHRTAPVAMPNIMVFSQNLRHFTHKGQPAFCKPGFEDEGDEAFQLPTHHDLAKLINAAEIAVVDARPRIVAPAPAALRPQERLVDLEHARLRHVMLAQPATAAATKPMRSRDRALAAAAAPAPVQQVLNASTWWAQAPADALLTAVVQQQQPFRKEPIPRDITLALLPDDDGEQAHLHQVLEGAKRGRNVYAPVDKSQCEHLLEAAVHGDRIAPWGVTDYMSALQELATELDRPLRVCAERFGAATVRPQTNGWRYHPVLGFAKKRS